MRNAPSAVLRRDHDEFAVERLGHELLRRRLLTAAALHRFEPLPLLDDRDDAGAVELWQPVGITTRFQERGDLRLDDIVEVLRLALVALEGFGEIGSGGGAVGVTHHELQIAVHGDLCRGHRRHRGARHALGEGARRERVRARNTRGKDQGGDDRRQQFHDSHLARFARG